MIQYSITDRAALLRLDNPPLNVLSFPLLDALVAGVERANADHAVDGIIIIGDASHFTSGADISIFQSLSTGDESVATSRRFQDVFNRIEASEKPVAAAIAGQVMGGALELSLAAHYRICTQQTRCSFPEVTLGIIPGAGGTQRLPRLVGPKAALDMILSGKPVDAQKALDIGLVDAVCAHDVLAVAAGKLLQSPQRPVTVSARIDKISDPQGYGKLFSEYRTRTADGRPEIIAPGVIIDSIERGIAGSFAAGLTFEQFGFAQCMATFAARNKIHLFFATRATAKIPELELVDPHPVSTTAVVGLGSMGCGIAQAFATAGKRVLLLDTDRDAAERGLERITESLERKVKRGGATREKTDAILLNIRIADSCSEFDDADLVIEAVYENVDLKKKLLGQIAVCCRHETIIATNTSTISLDTLAEGLPHPERLVGLHFFNPAHSMPLVEVIRRHDTSPAVLGAMIKFVKELRKTPVVVNNRVGFVVNRIFIPYFIEAFALIEEGASPEAIDKAMTDFGFPMGPLTLIDMTGIDILLSTSRQMKEAFPYHLEVPASAAALVEQEMLGQKTGCGVYRYEKGDRTPLENGALQPILDSTRMKTGSAPHDFTLDEITGRLMLRMVSEGFRVIEEDVALRESDIDVAMVLGTGFPDFRGGIIRYAYDFGLSSTITKLYNYAASCGERYQPCNYLLSLHKE